MLLSSDAGVQRLVRTAPNKLNRVSLIPREPSQPWPPTVVDWVDHAWVLDVHRSDEWHVRINGIVVGDGVHPLVPGARLLLGSTLVSFEQLDQRWPADVERERALIESDDDGAWQVFADELLERGDPLGRFFTERKSEDVAWLLELRPLLASQKVFVEHRPHRAWHSVRFEHELFSGHFHSGVIAAVLDHPFAWFVREARVAFTPPDDEGLADEFERQADAIVADITRFAGPHLQRVTFEGADPRRLPASPRPNISVAVTGP